MKVKANQVIHQSTQFQMLNENQCVQIIEAAYRVLEQCGCNVHQEEARQLLADAGCKVDGVRVKIPTHIIQKAMATVPRQITLYNQLGEPAVKIGARNGDSYFMAGLENQYRIDLETGKKRLTTKQDAYESGLVCEALDNIDIVSGLTCVSDCTPQLADVYEFRMLLESTNKPIVGWQFNGPNLDFQIELAAARVGGMDQLLDKPFILGGAAASVPLSHSEEAMDKVITFSKYGIPFQYVAATMMGGTSPVTLAGSLVQGLCESFVGMVVSQLVRPGAPMINTIFLDMFDMATMSFSMSSPEYSIGAMASADIYKYLDLPFEVHLGCTDSPIFDQQAAFDIGIQCFSALLSGSNLVNFAGYLETAMSSSLAVLVFIDEILDYLRTITRGVEVSTESLAEEVIKSVGPNGNFLAEVHTLQHFRENWVPKTLIRTSYENWQAAGAKDWNERCKDSVRAILAKGSQVKLNEDVVAQFDEIMAKAEAYYK